MFKFLCFVFKTAKILLLLLQNYYYYKKNPPKNPKISIEFTRAAFFRHFETHIEKLFHLSMPLKADNK